MNPTRPAIVLCAAVLAACSVRGPAAPAPVTVSGVPRVVGANPRTLSLQQETTAAGEVDFTLTYSPPAQHAGARAAEFYFNYGSGLQFLSAVPLASVTAAGKQVFAQPKGPGELRVVVLSGSNVNPMPPGPLLQLVFQSTGADRHLTLEDRRPVFAPLSADLGLPPVASVAVSAGSTP